jgi:carboxyl-terminal processing protease
LRGVTPDIKLPSMTDTKDFGESSFDNALPWSQIKPADYRPEGNLAAIVPMLIASHDKRVSQDQDFKYLQEDIDEFDKMRQKNLISLNEADRLKQRQAQESRDRSRDKNRDGDKSHKATAKAGSQAFQDDGMLSSERNLSADLAIENANRNAKDILLNEAAHVVSDQAGLLKSNPRLAEIISH